MSRVCASLIAALFPLAGGVPWAHAQTAATSGTSGARQEVTGAVSVAAGYDTDTPEQLRNTIDPSNPQSGGLHTSLFASGEYHWRGNRVQVGATGATALRYFAELGDLQSISHTGGIGLSAQLPAKISLLLNQSVAYSPSYLYALFPVAGDAAPGDAIPAAPDYAVNQFESYAYGSTLTLSKGLTRRSSLSLSGEFQYTDFQHETTARRDVSSSGVRMSFSRNVKRNTSIVAAYRLRTGDFGYGNFATSTQHGGDVGLNYSRKLSASRSLSVAIKAGGSMSSIPNEAPGVTLRGDSYRTVDGELGIDYQVNRTWRTQLALRRGVEFVADLTEPVAMDGVTASAGGLLSRHLELGVSAGYSSGQSIRSRSALSFKSYTGTVRLRHTLNQFLSAYTEYLYYVYDFRGQNFLAPGLPPTLDRNGVRVGVTLSLSPLRR